MCRGRVRVACLAHKVTWRKFALCALKHLCVWGCFVFAPVCGHLWRLLSSAVHLFSSPLPSEDYRSFAFKTILRHAFKTIHTIWNVAPSSAIIWIPFSRTSWIYHFPAICRSCRWEQFALGLIPIAVAVANIADRCRVCNCFQLVAHHVKYVC